MDLVIGPLDYFLDHFFDHFIEGGAPLGLREEWDAVHQYLGRGER